MDQDNGLDRLGRRLVQSVRDEMILSLDAALDGQRRDVFSKHLHARTQNLSPECRAFVEELVPFLVDSTLEVFLQVLDVDLARNGEQQELSLRVRNQVGEWLDAAQQTDSLEAEYGGVEGWVERFSQQRPNSLQQEVQQHMGLRPTPGQSGK